MPSYYTLTSSTVYHTSPTCGHVSRHILPSGRPSPSLRSFDNERDFVKEFPDRRQCSACKRKYDSSAKIGIARAALRREADASAKDLLSQSGRQSAARDVAQSTGKVPQVPKTPPAPEKLASSSSPVVLSATFLPSPAARDESEPMLSPSPAHLAPGGNSRLDRLRAEALEWDLVSEYDVDDFSADDLEQRIALEREVRSGEHDTTADHDTTASEDDGSSDDDAATLRDELSRIGIPVLGPDAVKAEGGILGESNFIVKRYTVDLSSLGGSADASVAGKSLPLSLTTIEAVVTEARASWIAASISAHVPPMHAVVVDEHEALLLMDVVSGHTLRDVIIHTPHKFTVDEASALAIASDVTVAVAALHGGSSQKGDVVAHRDIKPRNIMIKGDLVVAQRPHGTAPSSARAVLLDLGVAKIVGAANPIGKSSVGALGYMAPEVVKAEDSDPPKDYNALHADVWSLGLVLLELILTAKGTYKKFRLLHTGGSYADVGRLPGVLRDGNVPDGWATLITSCISTAPEMRPTAARVHFTIKEMLSEPKRDDLAVREIVAYIERRVDISETIYRVGSSRRQLVDWGRVHFMLNNIDSDLRSKFSRSQRFAFHRVVDSREFIFSIRSDEEFQELLHPELVDDDPCHVVYLVQHRTSLKGYVGLTNRKLSTRMKEHFRDSSTVADREMTNPNEWRWGALGKFRGTPEKDRIEVLFTLLLNTFLVRDTSVCMGYNTELGGRWGATKHANSSQ